MQFQLGLLGYPVEHSLSPWIHNRFLERTNLEGSYTLFEVNPVHLDENINRILQSDVLGFNVTVPFKQKIIPFLHHLDDHAAKMGAVNTVINKNGKWFGYNTDGQGYLRSLVEEFPELLVNKSISILILGAGGAARSIYYSLTKAGYNHVDVANRTVEKAEEIKLLSDPITYTNTLTIVDAEERINQYELVIQTTSVGMNEEKSIIQLKNLKPNTIVSDIVYQPIITSFLEDAIQQGAHIHLGHTMLLFQAQYAFEVWTGKKVNVDEMKKQLQTILEEKQHANR